ncbi:uncharacterized protein M421DRAFT_328840 [Didymella exigua CBS 183.55]|uniref:Uncharacterized protein n=1 Tax=Didymella exigua CBS 183.55 TaxID=1150837 RepID=A0A6A5R649_9PLEO|nr:uncharacterized protein M421DRAFT_328840 [Didymella exigua CBS 183.55]KAF1923192.1 hypothetical protein M421DRAFT_328840 [Didymella exigua CBS 183.55]
MGIVTTSPTSTGTLGTQDRRRGDTPSSRIFCATWSGTKACEKFEATIVRHSSTVHSLRNSFSRTVIGSGQLISKDYRQIHRIMEVENDAKATNSEKPFLAPDVQVILWFVLLCCLTEGMVLLFRW